MTDFHLDVDIAPSPVLIDLEELRIKLKVCVCACVCVCVFVCVCVLKRLLPVSKGMFQNKKQFIQLCPRNPSLSVVQTLQ